jgi:hypothetical protein
MSKSETNTKALNHKPGVGFFWNFIFPILKLFRIWLFEFRYSSF